MDTKLFFIVPVWCLIALTVLMLYLLREVPSVKEFIAWAIGIWPILAAIGGLGIIISGWIIKHDFGKKVKGMNRSKDESKEKRQLKLDVGKLLLDGKEILVDLEKMNAQLDSIGAVSAELTFEMCYKAASKTLQNTNYD